MYIVELFIVNDEFDSFSSILFDNDQHASLVFAERDHSVDDAARISWTHCFHENAVGIVNVDSFLVPADDSPI